MRRNLIEAVTGAVVLAVAAFFLVFVYTSTDIGTVDGYTLEARFDKVDGVRAGTDVRMSGIRIGSVSASRLDPATYLAIVEMSIDPQFQIPEDSSVAVSSDGLLGDRFLSLTPGGAEKMLAPGGQIVNTQGSIDLMSLIGQLIFSQAEKDG